MASHNVIIISCQYRCCTQISHGLNVFLVLKSFIRNSFGIALSVGYLATHKYFDNILLN